MDKCHNDFLKLFKNDMLAGKVSHELRLCDDEVAVIKNEFPNAVISQTSEKYGDGKTWFKIVLV